MSAYLIFKLKPFSVWILFLSFLLGSLSSWVSFIPMGGYAIRLVNPESWVQNFIAIQGPNCILVIIVFWLFRRYLNSE